MTRAKQFTLTTIVCLLSFLLNAAPAHAVGTVLGFIGTVLYTAVTYSVAGIPVGAILTSTVISTALSVGIAAATAPGAPRPAATDISRLRNIQRETAEPARIVYGETQISGVLLFARSVTQAGEEADGANFLHFVLAMAEGPIEDIFDIQLNDQLASNPIYRGVTHFTTFTGEREQEMITGPLLVGNKQVQVPKVWAEAHRPLNNVAGIYAALRHTVRNFPGGAPQIRAKVKGRRLYDPRLDLSLGGHHNFSDPETWEYSTNPALCVLDYLTNVDYGMAIPLSRLDLVSFKAAAEACDVMVPAISTGKAKNAGDAQAAGLPSSPDQEADVEVEYQEQKRYECNGVFMSDAKPIEVLELLVGTMAGSCFYFQGKWYCYAGTPQDVATWPEGVAEVGTQEIVITDDDIRDDAEMSFVPSAGRKDRVNTVRATYIEPADEYQASIAPDVVVEDFLNEDGGREFLTEIDLFMVSNVDQARRIAGIRLLEGRLGTRLTLPLKPKFLFVAPWSVVKVTLSLYGIENQEFRVQRITVDPNTGAPVVELAEYDAQIYNELNQPISLEPVSKFPDPFTIAKPSRVYAREAIEVFPTGQRVAKLVVTIVPEVTNRPVVRDGYMIRWKNSNEGDDAYRTVRIWEPDRSYEILNLQRGTYDVLVYAFAGGYFSDAFQARGRITYRTTPPIGPYKNAAVVQLPDTNERIFRWFEYNADGDTTRYEVFVRDDPDGTLGVPANLATEIQSATMIGSVSVLTPSDTIAGSNGLFRTYELRTKKPTTPGNYIAYIQSVDVDGLTSAQTAQEAPYRGIATVKFAVTAPVTAIALQREFSENWLPAGTTADLIQGRIGRSNELLGLPELTWQDVEDNNPTTSWDENAKSELVYISPVIDLGEDGAYTFFFDVGASEHTKWGVHVRTLLDDEAQDWSSWRTQRGRLARWAQFRLSAFNDVGIAKITSFSVRADERVDAEVVEDYNTAAYVGAVNTARIEEQTKADFLFGRQYGLTTFGVDGIKLTLAPFLVCGSSTSVTVPHHASYNVVNAFTIGFKAMFDTDARTLGTVNMVKKGTAYGVQFIANTGFKFTASGYAGEDPNGAPAINIHEDDPKGGRIYDVVYSYDGAVLRGYLDGELQFEYTVAFTLGTNSTDVTIAGDGFEGPIKDVVLYDRPLSTSEIACRADVAHHSNDPNIKFCFDFNTGTGTVARDQSPIRNHGTIANGSWASVGWRRSPDIPLDIFTTVPSWEAHWEGVAPFGTSVSVQGRLVNDTNLSTQTFVDIGQVSGENRQIGTTFPRANGGARLQLRQILRSTSFVNNPEISKLVYQIKYATPPGVATILASKNFQRIDLAAVVGIQEALSSSTVGGITAKTLNKTRHGARFEFKDQDGDNVNPIVDVRFEGILFGR